MAARPTRCASSWSITILESLRGIAVHLHFDGAVHLYKQSQVAAIGKFTAAKSASIAASLLDIARTE